MAVSTCPSSDLHESAHAISASLQSILAKITTDIAQVVVYHEHAMAARPLLFHYGTLLGSVTFGSAHAPSLSALRQIANALHDVIASLTQQCWINVALDWPIRFAPRTINETMVRFADGLSALVGRAVPRFAQTREMLVADLDAVHSIFASHAARNPRVQERLESAAAALRELGATPLDSSANAELVAMAVEMKDLLVRHEDYALEREIGSGATGKVYLARERKTNRAVAIKELISQELDEWDIRCFTREIRALATLRHPTLVEFFGATSKAPYWIVTGFLPGRSLHARLREQPGLDGTRKTIIAYQIAEGLAYVHSKNMMHRDMKSLNVLLDDNANARICDFGIARTIDSSNMMTGMIGTYHYMAPEVILESKYGFKADVFSFGMVLWEMIAHKVPFEWLKLDHLKITTAIVQGRRPAIPTETNAEMRALIAACWDMDPNMRPTFQQILEIMRDRQIAFDRADPTLVAAFYAKKNPALPANDDHLRVMELLKRPTPELLPCLQRINNSAVMVAALRTQEFVGLAVPLLAWPEIADTLAQTFCCVLDSVELTRVFLAAQGLSRMLAGGPNVGAAAVPLARRVAEFLSGAERRAIVAELICAGQADCAAELMEIYHLLPRAVIEPHFSRLLIASDVCPQACQFLLKWVNIGDLAPMYVTVALALASQSLPLIAKLLRDDEFRRLRLPGAGPAVAAAASDPKRSACALALAAGLPPEDLAVAARDSGFLRSVAADLPGPGRDAALALLAQLPEDAIAAVVQDPAFGVMVAEVVASPRWNPLLARMPPAAFLPLIGNAAFIHAVASAPFEIMLATAARLPSEAVAMLGADPALSATLAGAIGAPGRDAALAFVAQLPPAAAARVAGDASFVRAAAAAVASGAIPLLCKLPDAALAAVGADAAFLSAVAGAAAAESPWREQALALAAVLPPDAVVQLATDAGFARALAESPAGQALAAKFRLPAAPAVDPAAIRAMLARGGVTEAVRALAPTVRDRASADRALELLPAFQAHVGHPAVLGLLAAVGDYCGPALLNIGWVVSGLALALDIDKLLNVEANLALIAAIAESADINQSDALVRPLVRLLKSAECTADEMNGLLLVFEKMARRRPLLGVYQYLLQVAESRNTAAAVRALRVLSLQKLPKLSTRYGMRLLTIVQYFLESSEEEQRKAAAEALGQLAAMPSYAKQIAGRDLQGALQKAFVGTRRTDTFEDLLKVAKECQLRVGPTVATAAEALIRGLENGDIAAGRRILQMLAEVM